MRTSRLLWLLVLGACLSACYSPVYGPGQLACGPEGACPQGMSCQADNRCYPPGTGPAGADLSVPGVDMARPDSGGGGEDLALPPAGFLHTRGANIVNDADQVVRLRGVNWTGFDTIDLRANVSAGKTVASTLDVVKSEGYNLIRLPFRSGLLDSADGLSRLDEVVAGARTRGLRVVLARTLSVGGLWYDGTVTQARWIADWKALAARYRTNNTVVGFDLHHEPGGPAIWGDTNAAVDWRLAAETAGNEILKVHPYVLIIVQGVETVGGEGYWRGGNLKDAKAKPVVLSVPGRLVYATNDYSPSIVPTQTWFAGVDWAGKIGEKWRTMWGYLITENIAPVMIAGFGWKAGTDMPTKMKDDTWRDLLFAYILSTRPSFAFWRLDDDTFYVTLIKTDGNVEKMVHDKLDPLVSP